MMKSIKYIIIVIATFLTVLSTRAQEVSVNVNPMRQILPPHVAYYLSNPGQYFSISVQNNTQEQQNIYFGVRLTQLSGSDNLEIYVPGTPYIPKAPMVLNPGQMKALNEWACLIEYDALISNANDRFFDVYCTWL